MSANTGIGCLGDVVFQVSSDTVRTFEDFSRTTRANYVDHPVAGGKEASEFTGPSLDEVTFSIQLNASLGISPEDEMDALRAMAEEGSAHLLLIGNRPKGYFTIRQLAESVLFTLRGTPTVTMVDVTLVEYVDNLPGSGTEAENRDARNRDATGKGGPRKVAGAAQPSRYRKLTPRTS